MSDPTRWGRVRALFDEALERPADARGAWVREAAGADDDLAREVLSLLDALDRARDTLERPAAELAEGGFGEAGDDRLVGRRAGPWELVRLVGRGGMGAVYEATRADGDFTQRVALKFLRQGADSEIALRRFRYERQILASLNHRNIAVLHDGGVTDDGAPWFAMEYVDGVPITTWCREQRRSVRDRVALFRQVCAAVQHAHQQLVVHRDLKPGNILVTGDGTAKLLDFGIARLVREEEGAGQLPLTRGGVRVFTPEYASPEQVKGLALTPASDIYSLGVVLFELLTGRRPIATEGKLLAEIEVAVCTVPAPRPGSVVTDEAARGFAEGTAARLRKQLDGDLEAILLTALAKEPALRYGTVAQFAADLRRWMDGHPVTARRAWAGYRLRKFIGRHPLEVAAGVLAVGALVGGSLATARQARIARTEASKASEVNTFISNMLAAADPGVLGRDVTVREVLDRAAADVQSRHLDPQVEAEIRHTIAQSYYGLGRYDSAAVHAGRAFALRRGVFGMQDPRTAASLSYVIVVDEALGAYARAESLSRQNVDQWRRMTPANPAELGTALDNLGRLVQAQGRIDESLVIQREALAAHRQATDSAGLFSMTYSLNNLAVTHTYQGEFARAESLLREAVAVHARCCGQAAPTYAELLKSLGSVIDQADPARHAEADSLAAEAVARLREALGPTHANYLRAVNNLAELRYTAGDARSAATLAAEVVAAIGGGLPESEQTAASALQVEGLALDALGEFDRGEVALRRALTLRQRHLPADHWAIASSEAVVGYHLGRVKRYREGEALLLHAFDGLAKARGPEAQVTRRVAFRLAEMYGHWGRAADSVRWAERAEAKAP